MNLFKTKAPKIQKLQEPAKREEISASATALARDKRQRRRGYAGSRLAGETGGYQGYAGTTAL